MPPLLDDEDGEWQRRCRCGVGPCQEAMGILPKNSGSCGCWYRTAHMSAFVAHENSWRCREQVSALSSPISWAAVISKKRERLGCAEIQPGCLCSADVPSSCCCSLYFGTTS